MLPRARRDDLLIRSIGDQTVVLDQRRGRLHVLNRTAALVWRNCDGQRPVGELVTLVGHELGEAVDERVIWLGLARLQRARLLEERVARPREGAGTSRRELLRGVARLAAGAVALPSVL